MKTLMEATTQLGILSVDTMGGLICWKVIGPVTCSPGYPLYKMILSRPGYGFRLKRFHWTRRMEPRGRAHKVGLTLTHIMYLHG